MDSKIARAADRELVYATQKLKPEERVNAFLTHCRLVTQIAEAGRAARAPRLRPPTKQ